MHGKRYKHEDWLDTRHDWLGLCPTIPNLGYATGSTIIPVVVLDSVITHTSAWFLDREIHQLV